ncbi:MAG: zinc ribbon domain-containing protein [Halorhodospira sp.]
MPTYDYRCPSNGEVVEVQHGMDEHISTWGELCHATGRDPGDTPAEAPVERLISGGSVLSSGGRSEPEPAPTCCPGGTCGL